MVDFSFKKTAVYLKTLATNSIFNKVENAHSSMFLIDNVFLLVIPETFWTQSEL